MGIRVIKRLFAWYARCHADHPLITGKTEQRDSTVSSNKEDNTLALNTDPPTPLTLALCPPLIICYISLRVPCMSVYTQCPGHEGRDPIDFLVFDSRAWQYVKKESFLEIIYAGTCCFGKPDFRSLSDKCRFILAIKGPVARIECVDSNLREVLSKGGNNVASNN